MAKTNPIGVRFNEDLLEKVNNAGLATSPQKALNLYEKSYLDFVINKVEENNKPENSEKIEEDRERVTKSNYKNPLTEKESTKNSKTDKQPELSEWQKIRNKKLGW